VPTYEYACTECGERLEVVQKFSDGPLTTCEACGGKLRKVFSPVGIVFKGSGFYRTDSRNGGVPAGSKSGDSGDSSAKPDSGGSGSGSGDKADSTAKSDSAKPSSSSPDSGSSSSSSSSDSGSSAGKDKSSSSKSGKTSVGASSKVA
jgi:putative FmdB family regulatory protein